MGERFQRSPETTPKLLQLQVIKFIRPLYFFFYSQFWPIYTFFFFFSFFFFFFGLNTHKNEEEEEGKKKKASS